MTSLSKKGGQESRDSWMDSWRNIGDGNARSSTISTKIVTINTNLRYLFDTTTIISRVTIPSAGNKTCKFKILSGREIVIRVE